MQVALSTIRRELLLLTEQPPPTYPELWKKIVNGELRAVQIRGRWFADPIEVAEDLGLTVKQNAA